MSKQTSIARKSSVIAFIFAISAFLGLGRESAIAYMFGASGTTDSYFIAATIPYLFTEAVTGSITSCFIVVYAGYNAVGNNIDASEMTNVVFTYLSIVLIAIFFACMIWTPWIIRIIAPNFQGSFILTVKLTRIVLPYIIFGGLLGILIGINNSHHSFVTTALNSIIHNIVIIMSVVFLGRVLGIYGLAIGLTIAIISQFSLQLLSARHYGFKYKPNFNFRHSGVKELFLLIIPFIFSQVAGQINLIVDRLLASGLHEGTISALYYANKLIILPNTIFSAAVAMVVFPTLVRNAALEDWSQLMGDTERATRLLVLVLVPSIVGMYILRVQLVQLFFQHGVFSTTNSLATANIVPFLLGNLFFAPISEIFSQIYFAMKKVYLPVFASTLSVIVNIGLSFILVKPMQQNGLALSNSISSFVCFSILFGGFFAVLKMNNKVKIQYRSNVLFLLKVVLAGLIMGLIVSWSNFLSIQGILFNIVLKAFIGIVIYIVLAFLLDIDEIRNGCQVIFSKIKHSLCYFEYH